MTKLFTDDNQDDVIIQIPDDEPLKPFREKYKDDKGVAMALVEKDRFIKQLQTETAGLRADLSTRKSVEDAVDRLLQVQPKTNDSNTQVDTNTASQQNSQQTSGISLEDVEKLLSTKELEVTAKNNIQYTQSELKKAYGDDWASIVQQKAKALGESVEFLESLAKTKPQILLKLLGDAPKPQAQASLFKGENTTAAVFGTGNVQQRTMSFYNALKAKDAAKYWTPAIQNQMHKDSLQLREAFFDVP